MKLAIVHRSIVARVYYLMKATKEIEMRRKWQNEPNERTKKKTETSKNMKIQHQQ